MTLMSLTPELCRAGRALLAWTQRDLASRAHAAVSTVADFERGKRTPIANSLDALREALEAGGIRFDGSSATLTSGTATFPALAGGQPTRWVDAADLTGWADRRDGQSGLPELISRLVLASAGTDARPHFPASESVQHGGWDGWSESPRAVDDLPAGSVGWELTAQRERIKQKAQDDFEKRAAAGDPATRAATTFVFVVMRTWPDKDVWAAEQRKRRIFADVRALDVDDLVHWLDAYPGVQGWLAERIGKRPRSGVASLEEMWQRWSLATNPPLPERIVLAGRDVEATRVHEWLKNPPSVLTVRTATTEEAVAFLWAAIAVLPEETRDAYLMHALYAQSDDAVRELSGAMKALIVVMDGESPGFAQSVAAKGHYVYAMLSPSGGTKSDVLLASVHKYDLQDALESIGAESDATSVLGAETERGRARALAIRSGGSIATLRRIMANQTMPPPRWVETTPPAALRALLLAGAWDEAFAGDRTMIATLAERPYHDVARDLEPLASGVDAPRRRSGTKVRLVSPLDSWLLLAPRFTKADVDAFFDIAHKVLHEIDERFGQRGRSQLLAFGERKPAHSRELRRGIVEVLDIMAMFGDHAPKHLFLAERVDGFVRELFKDADAPLWWSLRDNLPGLAEASPDSFLDAIEASLDKTNAPVTALLHGDSDGIFARDYVSDLTSALERLAWPSRYFPRAISVLARLAARDAKENRHGNRPAATLRQIFLPWMPQTFVRLEDRLTVLDTMRREQPDVAWKLMVSLLPKSHDTSSYSSQPVWRRVVDEKDNDHEEEADVEAELATPQLLQMSADQIFKWLLEDAGRDTVRWSELFGNLIGLSVEQQEQAALRLLDIARHMDKEDDRLAARDFIRGILNRHREFAHTFWAMPESVLNPLEEAYVLLAPASIVDRERWVFDNRPTPPLSEPGHDLKRMEQRDHANRLRVARELVALGDVDLIFAMASSVENPVVLGMALIDAGIAGPLREAVLERACRSEDAKSAELGRGMVLAGVPELGADWAAAIVRVAVTAEWPSSATAVVLRGMPATSQTWGLAREAGPDVEKRYWESIPWLFLIHSDSEDLLVAAQALLNAGRFIESVALIGQTGPAKYPSDLLLRAMTAAGPPLGKRRDHNDDAMLSHYCGLIFDRLIADESVDRDVLLKLEWTYFGLLHSSGREAQLLQEGLAASAEFFLTVVSTVYRGEGEDDADASEEEVARRSGIATQSYTLLDSWSKVPGSREDGMIDGDALDAWVKTARELAVSAKRIAIVDQQIGTILSVAKPDAYGDWPPKQVRDVIERVKSKELELGFQIGTRNRRGATSRGPLDGGELERDLKSHYDALSKKFRIAAPHTARVLREIGGDYKVEAVYFDQFSDAVDLI